VPDEVRLRRALELAWHQILSGGSPKDVMTKLDKEPVPPPLHSAFERIRARIAKLPAVTAPKAQ
jgi:hypothetical protein